MKFEIKQGNDRIYKRGGQRMRYLYVKNPSRNGWTYEEANQYAQSISDAYKSRYGHGKIWISLKYHTGWMDRRGGSTGLGTPVQLFTYDDYDMVDVTHEFQTTFHEIMFRVLPEPRAGGKDTEHNDCLFNVINVLLNRQLPEKYNTPEKLKASLKIKRDSPIDLKLMPQVENKYRVNINVEGDHLYITPKKYARTITIKLQDGHYLYERDMEKRKELNARYSYKPLLLNVYHRGEEGDITLYDGKKTVKMSMEDYNTLSLKKRNDIIYCRSDDEDLVKFYKEYKNDAAIIFKESDKMINLFKSPAIQAHAKALFYELSYSTMKPEPIYQAEASRLHIRAALIKAIPGEYKTTVYDYDVNSMYGSLMSTHMFPMKEGEFKTLTTLPDTLEYGIYKCLIESRNHEESLLFRFAKDNEYTHYDIMAARLLGLKITLMKGKNNCLIYTKDKLEYGQRLFKPTVNFLYKLKAKKLPRVKQILNSLWGSLCEIAERKITLAKDEEFEIPASCEIRHIYSIGDKLRLTLVNNDERLYTTNYARIGPFLTGQARYFMAKTLAPHQEHLLRVHTDGFVSTKPIPELTIGDKIGEWKMKSYSSAVIKNSNLRTKFGELKMT